jgi:hypothetical protein
VVPYAVPVFAGGIGYGYGYDYAPPQQPVTVVLPQAPPPTVIINNHFGDAEGVRSTASVSTESEDVEQPQSSRRMKVYEAPKPARTAASAAPAAVVDERPNIYLIIGRDGIAREAIGYWVRDGRLHFVTATAEIRQVGLDELDLEASERVNAQRNVPFDLRRLLN